MNEADARRVLLVRSFETGSDSALWTLADRAWATRLALQTAGREAPFERFLVERSGHALERLLARGATSARWVQRRGWRPQWVVLAVLAAAALGAAFDRIGDAQRIDLLAPPVWAVLAWNLVVYVGLVLHLGRPRHGLRRWLVRAEGAGPSGWWTRAAAPLLLARGALVLHLAAAAFAAGLVAGMYVRGLALDYRAGWQSTFLEPAQVQALLDVLLAPASWATGIAVPAVEALRVTPQTAAAAPAAPWIHLYAATLVDAVVLPRLVLAWVAAWRAGRFERRFPLALGEPYFARLRQLQQGGALRVQVVAHGAELSPPAVLGLRTMLVAAYGDETELEFAPAIAYGGEDAALALQAGTMLRVAVFDLGATPEPETQGRLLQLLAAGGTPLVAVIDESAFAERFATLPERIAERRAAWEDFARSHGAGFVATALVAPQLEAARRALHATLAP